MEAIGVSLAYKGLVPDVLIRYGIRTLLSSMVTSQSLPQHLRVANKIAYVADLKQRGLAEHTAEANEQHYEVPSEFYEFVMGKYKKYSCGLWPEDGRACTLDESESSALTTVCERAEIVNKAGFRVLDMGCGWGSFSLFAAERFPLVSFTGVSNSNSQREYIMGQAALRGLTNLNIVTSDINKFDGAGREFDRVVSIEMMEHVKNYQLLLNKVASWMRPEGKFFVHIFTHAHTPFHYTDGWMAKTFFSGGQMPSDDLLLYFQEDLSIQNHWVVNGKHYEKTCNEWLKRMDSNKSTVLKILGDVYGADNAYKRYTDWRLFFLACAELFGYANGEEWAVSHYLFAKK